MRIDANRLGRCLGLWASGSDPLYVQLADAIDAAIERGEVPTGAVLPTERALSAHLSVSRTTVVNAYAALKERGRLDSRQGRGTWVCEPAHPPVIGAPQYAVEAFSELFTEHPGGAIDLQAGAMRATPIVQEVMSAYSLADLADLASKSHGYLPAGLPALRAAIADCLAEHGPATQAEDIVVTTGAMQAIGLIAGMLARHGDTALVEDPTYPGALDAIGGAGVRPIGVPIDDHGIVPDVLAEMLLRARPAFVYVVPTHHNPTAAVMTARRAHEVLELCTRAGVPVVEDTTLRRLVLDGTAPPASIAVATGHPDVITIGSFSKIFWGGLRTGWVRARRSVAEQITRRKASADFGSSVASGVLALELLPHLDTSVAQMVHGLRESRDTFAASLHRLIPEWEFAVPDGGPTLWVRLPGGDARSFAHAAQRAGVSILPGPSMSAAGGWSDHIRLPFVHTPLELEHAANRLAAAWDAYRSTASTRAGALVV